MTAHLAYTTLPTASAPADWRRASLCATFIGGVEVRNSTLKSGQLESQMPTASKPNLI